jgi:hypothetical protein
MDIYDGADWTEMDIEDLKAEIPSRPFAMRAAACPMATAH